MTAAATMTSVPHPDATATCPTTTLDIAALIQRLFELGMDVAAICGRISDPAVTARLHSSLDDIDHAVREMRAASFAARRTA